MIWVVCYVARPAEMINAIYCKLMRLGVKQATRIFGDITGFRGIHEHFYY